MDGLKLCPEAYVEEERGTQCICEKKSRAIVTRLESKSELSELVLSEKIATFDCYLLLDFSKKILEVQFSTISMKSCIEKEIRTKNVTTVLRAGRSQYNDVKFNLVTVVEGRAAI